MLYAKFSLFTVFFFCGCTIDLSIYCDLKSRLWDQEALYQTIQGFKTTFQALINISCPLLSSFHNQIPFVIGTSVQDNTLHVARAVAQTLHPSLVLTALQPDSPLNHRWNLSPLHSLYRPDGFSQNGEVKSCFDGILTSESRCLFKFSKLKTQSFKGEFCCIKTWQDNPKSTRGLVVKACQLESLMDRLMGWGSLFTLQDDTNFIFFLKVTWAMN